MSFLAPSLLWGLLAASVPFIIHLVSNRRVQKVEFSTVRFIKELEHETIRQLKLRQWILLILRTIAIVLLVMVFARPVKVGYFPVWAAGDQSARLTFLLDNSASISATVNGESLLQRSKVTVLKLLGGMQDSPFIEIYQSSPLKRVLSEKLVSIETVEQVISTIDETTLEDDLWHGVNTVLNQSDLNVGQSGKVATREFYIFSDFPATVPEAWQLYSQNISDSPAAWRFYLFPQPVLKDNMTILSATVASSLLMPNQLMTVTTDISNQADVLKNNTPVQLYFENNRVGQVVSDFAPLEMKNFAFQAFPGKTGTVHAVLEIPEDDYGHDNQRFFQFYVPDRIRCKIVASSAEEMSPLKFALDSINRQSQFVETEEQISSDLAQLSLDEVDVLILLNPSVLSNSAYREVERFTSDGGGVIIFLGDRIVTSGGELLRSAFAIPRATDLIVLGSDAFHSVDHIAEEHPLLHNFPVKELTSEMPQLFSHVRMASSTGGDVLLSLSDSDPLLMEFRRHLASVLVFTTLPDLRWTDLPVRGIFVPLLHRMLVYLAGEISDGFMLQIDSQLTVPLSGSVISRELTLVKPSGKRVLMVPDYQKEQLNIAGTDEVGVYHLFADKNEIASFVVNIAESEDPGRRLRGKELMRLFPEQRSRLVDADEDALLAVSEARRGTELWRPFLLAALAVLALETWVGRVRKEEESS
ncbi:MAG: BatA domain-containing protein [Candidatus Marinimicrobia bacterium]|nr:hypothetical protein [Candidatus Neomarinimicrobiota bacterium]MDP6594227.1 BatA domain-containing protein [Candidatus Neomarinimicrobiota bacterium]MDP6836761.1 BatA domain-containing protein [Candidatus Neomarinimicrobiota bacterium]MDP6967051.1 BatA domain-containing protein [Candidatus Neomarinimicrobiota bacterium]